MQSTKPSLQPIGNSTLTAECKTILIVVPGIDADPAVFRKPGSIVSSLAHIINELTSKHTYLAWWDHRLSKTHLLSYQHQHVSADALRHEVFALLGRLPGRLCPIIFVGHSIGGLLIKESLRSWDMSASRNEASLCIAGVILLGTPHTWHAPRALHFCKMASLAYLNQKYTDDGYPAHLIAMCQFFEAMRVPTFTIYEGEKTKLGKLKKDLLVDQELAILGWTDEQQFSMRLPHKELCHAIVTRDLYVALQTFLESAIQGKLDQIHSRRGTKRSTLSINSRPTLRTARSEATLSYVESPIEFASPSSFSPLVAGATESEDDAMAESQTLPPMRNIEYNIPQQSALSFPRDDILQPVEEVLLRSDPWQDSTTKSDRVRAFALCGSSGMGKSASALQFVHKHRDRYENVFWVSAEDTSKLFSAFTQIAFKLGIAERSKPYDRFDCQKKVRDWFMFGALRSDQSAKVPWLLILDNVKRPEDLEGFWPSRGGGDLLVTTKCSLLTLNSFCGQFGIEVTPFGKDVALAFLTSLTPDQIQDPIKLAEATEIAEILGGSPLALISLLSLIKQHRLDPTLIRKASRRRESLESGRSRPDLSGESINQLGIVVEPLLEKLVLGASLMDVLCLLDSEGAQDWVLTTSVDSPTLAGYPIDKVAYGLAKQELLDFALVTKVKISEDNGIAAPHLFREVVRQRMTPARFQDVFEGCLQMLSRMWPNMSIAERHNRRRWGTYDVLIRHVRSLLEVSPVDLELPIRLSLLFARLLNNAAWSMYERGDYEDAKSFADHAKEIAPDPREPPGAVDCETLPLTSCMRPGESLEDDAASIGRYELPDLLSQVYYTLGAIAQITHKKDESLSLHAKLLVLRKNLKAQLRNGDELLAHAYNEIGNDFMTDDEYDIAVGFYQTSIKIYENLPNVKRTTLALPRVNLGLAYWLQGDNQKALEVVQRALKEHEQEMGGPDDKLTMKTGRLLFAMGNISLSLGFEEESFKYHQRAYNQFKTTIGSGHNRSCDVLWRLADHYERRREYDKALNALNDALENVWNRPLFDREKARLCFKKAKVMQRTREYSQPMHYQPLLNVATQTYYRYRSEEKQPSQLTEEDFNELVMFWSR